MPHPSHTSSATQTVRTICSPDSSEPSVNPSHRTNISESDCREMSFTSPTPEDEDCWPNTNNVNVPGVIEGIGRRLFFVIVTCPPLGSIGSQRPASETTIPSDLELRSSVVSIQIHPTRKTKDASLCRIKASLHLAAPGRRPDLEV
jgi:hypothetical protein